MPIKKLPRQLNKSNIETTITNYLSMINEIPLKIESDNLLDLLTKLKREPIKKGPYPDVSVFEASNRIMTDLVILYGVKILLDGVFKEFIFKEYKVEYGNEDNNNHDISAEFNGSRLIGEAFNVAVSYYQNKKSQMITKLRNNSKENDFLLIMYNEDAVKKDYKPKRNKNEYYLPVKVELKI